MLPHVPGSFPPFLVVSHPYWCYSVLLINLPTPTQDSNLNKEHAHAAVMLRDLYSQSHSDRQAFPSDRIVSTNKGCASGGCQEAKRSVLMRANISDNPPFFFFFLINFFCSAFSNFVFIFYIIFSSGWTFFFFFLINYCCHYRTHLVFNIYIMWASGWRSSHFEQNAYLFLQRD